MKDTVIAAGKSRFVSLAELVAERSEEWLREKLPVSRSKSLLDRKREARL